MWLSGAIATHRRALRPRRAAPASRPGARAVLAIAAAAAAIASAGLGVPPRAEAAGRSYHLAADSTQSIRLPKGKSATVRTDSSFADIIVGDPEIATVAPLTDQSLYIIGKKIGSTSVAVFDSEKHLVGEIEVEVASDTSKLAIQLRQNIPGSNIKVSSVNGRIMLSGNASDGLAVQKAMAIAGEYGEDVINSITIGRSQQVLLEVRFIEAFRDSSRELGINWRTLGGPSKITFGTRDLVSGTTPFGSLLGVILSGGIDADALIQALEQRGVARRLAEPNLIALSGDTATFLAGGEFPFPVGQDDNTITLEFKKFGVSLAFTPTVLADGVINLQIDPEVSQLDNTNAIRLSDIEIPSLTVRRASTTVELRDGQSFVIAGLLQSNSSTQRDQLPWMGDVPVLGALFRSSAYRRDETDLAIIVTPRIVEPIAPGDRVATPLDATRPANEIDFFLLGKDEVKSARVTRHTRELMDRPWVGHIIDIANR
jgi:pilus assembly protein CpaC